MRAGAQLKKQVLLARKGLKGMHKSCFSAGKGLVAAATGVALFLANTGKSVADKAVDIKDLAFNNNKNSGEVVQMKKSTMVALMVALAAVAGVLGALYFYVLRRERELDEYEQLLFSEDFNDDLLDDDCMADEAPETV